MENGARLFKSGKDTIYCQKGAKPCGSWEERSWDRSIKGGRTEAQGGRLRIGAVIIEVIKKSVGNKVSLVWTVYWRSRKRGSMGPLDEETPTRGHRNVANVPACFYLLESLSCSLASLSCLFLHASWQHQPLVTHHSHQPQCSNAYWGPNTRMDW